MRNKMPRTQRTSKRAKNQIKTIKEVLKENIGAEYPIQTWLELINKEMAPKRKIIHCNQLSQLFCKYLNNEGYLMKPVNISLKCRDESSGKVKYITKRYYKYEGHNKNFNKSAAIKKLKNKGVK